MKLILQAIKALFRKIEASIDNAKATADSAKATADSAKATADSAKATADSAKATADSAKATADSAYTEVREAVKLVNVMIPTSMESELATLLNGLQTKERGQVTYNGKMFSTVFYTGGNVMVEFRYVVGSVIYFIDMLLNSTTGNDAQGFLHLDCSITGTDTKIFFIRLGNKVNVSYIDAIRLA